MNRINSEMEGQGIAFKDSAVINNTMMKCSIESDFSEVRKVASVLQEFCDKEQIASDVSGQLELILVEAVNNVIEHAYENKSGLPINIQLEALSGKAVMTIKDKGLPVPESVQKTKSAMPDVFDLPEGGWGLGLIHTLTDDIQHYAEDNLNVMVLTKHL